MSEPLVEVVRSGFRECVHHGSAVVLDSSGEPVVALGEVHTPIFPRSSNKPLQAVALLRNGFEPESTRELAITTASHEGEPGHVELVRALLDRFGLSESQLSCPDALPSNEFARAREIVAGTATSPVYMNCSGKHAAMLATCAANGWSTDGYADADHPLQVAVAETVMDLTGEPETEIGIDGCGLPIVPVSLVNLARAYRTLATAPDGTPEHAVAQAIRSYPWVMSGTGKDDEILLSTVPGLTCKSGADGIWAAALGDGTAIAVKVDDGAERARLPLAASLLRDAGVPWTEDLADLANSPVLGGGHRVGTIRALRARE